MDDDNNRKHDGMMMTTIMVLVAAQIIAIHVNICRRSASTDLKPKRTGETVQRPTHMHDHMLITAAHQPPVPVVRGL